MIGIARVVSQTGRVLLPILLDAAGTLIEPTEPVAAVYARHFAKAGWPVEEEAVKMAFRQVFRGAPMPDYGIGTGDAAERAWWREVVGETAWLCGIEAGEGFGGLFEGLFAHYNSGTAWRVFPEVRGVLERLRGDGRRLAVVSNFDLRLHRILADLGLAGYFEVIITSAEASARKPEPGIFQLAMVRLGVAAALHIGDSAEADGQGARAAGLPSFILDRPAITLEDALSWIESQNESK